MKTAMRASTSTSTAVILTVLLVASFSVEISAKRGCSAFGHSCYGGHGKRSYSEAAELEGAPRTKDAAEMVPAVDYELARPNVESVALIPSQAGYSRQEQHLPANSLQRLGPGNWSLFFRKLMVPFRRPYMAYSEAQK